MAFASIGSLGAAQSSTANQTSAVLTTTAAAEAGNYVVLVIAVDNFDTTSVESSAVSGVTNSGTANTWVKLKEFTFGQGAAQAGATCSMWGSLITSTIASGGTITASFTDATNRDKSAMTAWEFSTAGGVQVEATNTYGGSAASMSLNATTANIACLRIVAQGTEDNSTNDIASSAGTWTNIFTMTTTSGGGGAANIGVRATFGIVTGTGNQFTFSNGQNGDCAGLYVALKEVSTAPTGTLGVTEATDTADGAFTGRADPVGTLGVTDAVDTPSFPSATVEWRGTLGTTDATDTASFQNALVGLIGPLAVTEAVNTAAFPSATVEWRGTFGPTEAADAIVVPGLVQNTDAEGDIFGERVLTNTDPDWSGKTLRQWLAPSLLAAVAPGDIRVRFQFAAGTSGQIDAAYIGHAATSGDAYDFDGTQVQLKFGGSNTRAVSGAEEVTSDTVAFTYNSTRPIIVSASFSGTAVHLGAY